MPAKDKNRNPLLSKKLFIFCVLELKKISVGLLRIDILLPFISWNNILERVTQNKNALRNSRDRKT